MRVGDVFIALALYELLVCSPLNFTVSLIYLSTGFVMSVHTPIPRKRTFYGSSTQAQAVAFIDMRYLRWLCGLDGKDASPVSRGQINAVVANALDQANLGAQLLRSYCYADQDDKTTFDDQTLRLLPQADTDGELAMVRQMSADLMAVANGAQPDTIVIASDDQRLIHTIDVLKLQGVRVCLLADERAKAMPRLQQHDPEWARLLREADRRLIVHAQDLAFALSGGSQPGQQSVNEDVLQEVVAEWWAALPLDEQDWLREELPALRGVPPELDRELLRRTKTAIHRSLSEHEKRLLREQARRIALGDASSEVTLDAME